MTRNRILLKLALSTAVVSATLPTAQVFAQGKVQAKPASTQRPAVAEKTPATNAADQAAKELPSIVASVNGEPITRDDLAKLCIARYGAEVIDNVVNKTLIMQACQAQGIVITAKNVDDEIDRTAAKFNLSTKLYLKLIEDERDITYEQYASDIIWPMLALRQLARDKVAVDPKEIDQAIETEFGKKIQVRLIAVKDPSKAADLHKQALANPENFKTLAKQHSEDPSSASVEGLIPPVRRFNQGDLIEQVAFTLQPGQVSDVFKVGDMSVMLQCVRHIEASLLTADQLPLVQARFRSELEDQHLREMADTIFDNLRKQSNVQIVYSNPTLAAQYPEAAAIINQRPIPLKTLEDECIKRFGPSVLEVEINRRILSKAVQVAGIQVTPEDLQAEIARAADYYGVLKADGTPDLQAWIARIKEESKVTEEIYTQDVVWPTVALKKLVANRVKVTEEDLQKAFASDFGPRAEVLAIVCSNQRVAQEVWQKARDNSSEQFFGELASQYSVEPTSRSNYGKVPPIRQHSDQPTLEQAAFKLQPGELSGIIEIGNQYIILKGQGRTQPVTSDINAVRAELTKELYEEQSRQAMHAHLTKLVSEASIDNFLVPKAQLGKVAAQNALNEAKSR